MVSFNSSFARIVNDPTPAPLPDDSLSFCRQQKYAKACLNVLLTYRCGQYYYPLYPVEAQLCSYSAQSMINYLDYKTVEVIKDNKIYRFKIIFTRKLRKLIKDPVVQKYLRSLESDLSESFKYHKPFDLFKYTLRFAKKRDIAIQWLAILFQDTTFSQVQVQYLDDLTKAGVLSQDELKTKETMRAIATLLEPKNLMNEDFRSWLKLYPEVEGNNLNSYLNPSFYHFYPMALIASHLKSSHVTKKYAFLIPFTLNSDYEFQSLDPDRWPWRHPAPFKITPDLNWKMIDIYTGLVASLYGANREELVPSFEKFKKGFASNPFKTMQDWAYKD